MGARIAIVGTGAVGGYAGAHMAQAGEDVTFVDFWPENVETIRAKGLRISRLALGASIRTTDSLEEGHSRFMAEILRLKQVLELPAPAMFLLDELLHGTNSHDRALGSEGLIRALLARGAIGLVTTHDLALSHIADELGSEAANVHFEDRLENGRLVFDYLVRPGIVERSNALDLMRAVGLDV